MHTKPDCFREIIAADAAMTAERNRIAELDQSDHPGPTFFALLDAELVAICRAAESATAPDLHRLAPVVEQATGVLKQIRSIESPDGLKPCTGWFWAQLDHLSRAVVGLTLAPRPPKIESPLTMAKSMSKEGDAPDKWLNAVQMVWRHVDRIELLEILCGHQPDLSPDTHPDVQNWHRERNRRPFVATGALIGYTAEVEHRRSAEAVEV